jgi:ribosomal protein S6--L-glutamate ligase
MKKLRIGFLLPRYPACSRSFMPAVVQAVAEAGVIVDVIHPVDRAVDLSEVRVGHDLYVLRHTSRLSLSLAGALHELGAVIVNPYPVSAALTDKIVTTRILQAAGVPLPATYVASHPDQLLSLLDSGPLIVKPYKGSGGHQIRIIRTPSELAEVDCSRDPVFAQRYHANDGRDRKIYAIGGQLFGVKKVFPRRTEEEKYGEPFTMSPEMSDIVRRCGEAFGIDLYGVDIIESGGTPYVVDMCSIPGFKGVPDAIQRLAQYFCRAAERAARELPKAAPSAAARSYTDA